MRAETAMGLITPGALEVAKQDWRRDTSTWRSRFMALHLVPKLSGLDDEEAAALRDAIADALEVYFAQMQTFQPVIRGQGFKRYVSQ